MRSLAPDVFEFNDRFQVAYRQKDPNPAADILATSLCRLLKHEAAAHSSKNK
jgi:hypothetical protein